MSKTTRKQFLLTLNYVKDFYYKRVPHHKSHIEYFSKESNRMGIIPIGGTEFPPDSGFIFITTPEKEAIEKLIINDPFYKNRLINGYTIEEIESRTQKSIEELSKDYTYICK